MSRKIRSLWVENSLYYLVFSKVFCNLSAKFMGVFFALFSRLSDEQKIHSILTEENTQCDRGNIPLKIA